MTCRNRYNLDYCMCVCVCVCVCFFRKMDQADTS